MSLNCGSEGAFSALAVDAVGATFGASSERYEFLAENVGLRENVAKGLGITGELDNFGSHLRPGSGYVAGQILMNVSAKELDNWLQRILGGPGKDVSNVFTPGSTFTPFDMLIKRDKATYKYTECVVAAAVFSGETQISDRAEDEPQLIKMLLSIMGKDEDDTASWPGTPPPVDVQNKLYWLSADSTLTLMSTAYPFDDFRLTINNMMRPRLRNSLRPVCIESQGRMITMDTNIPHSATAVTNLYNTRPDGAGSLSFLSSKNLGNSDSETTFTLPKLYGEKVTPQTRGRTETHLPIKLQAYIDPAVSEYVMTVTNDFPPDA